MDNISINYTAIYATQNSRRDAYLDLLGTSLRFINQAYCVKDFPTYKKCIENFNSTSLKLIEKFAEEDLIDCVKIIMCFENFLKGLLIKKGYIVHEIDLKGFNGKFRQLGNINSSPVKISDYTKIEDYVEEPESNFNVLRGLKLKTLQINAILKNPAYQRIIDLPIDVTNAVKNYNERRNILHLKLLKGTYFHSNKLKDLETIIRFVNNKLIKSFNYYMLTGDYTNKKLLKNINVA